MAENPLICPVCGYPHLSDPPYDKHWCASFEICSCCGTQFGYDDADGGVQKGKAPTHAELRRRWIEAGMKWWSTATTAPPGWDPRDQLANILENP